MDISADYLKKLITIELEYVDDDRVLAHVQALLVQPYLEFRDWDYGEPGQQFPCWMVFRDSDSNKGIAYCESGFGPSCPWGLLWLGSQESRHLSMGMDSSWYSSLLDAYFESFAVTELPIWRIVKNRFSDGEKPISPESSWEATWEQLTELRKADPETRYDIGHSITYRPKT
ncbi:MAG: hypothetical protein H7X92_11355 [Chitinophagales bacterium]|nr:hypothetical protein [Hyphomicrobiales bacterium]